MRSQLLVTDVQNEAFGIDQRDPNGLTKNFSSAGTSISSGDEEHNKPGPRKIIDPSSSRINDSLL